MKALQAAPSATIIEFPEWARRSERERVPKAAQRRIRWIAAELTAGGVPVPESEVEAACDDWRVLCEFARRYGQSIDWIADGRAGRTLVWWGYNLKRQAAPRKPPAA